MATERDFHAWLTEEIWPEAQAAGVSRKTFDVALGDVTLDWDLPELVPPGTSAPHTVEEQAEFRSPAAYFDQRILNTQVAIGRKLIGEWSEDARRCRAAFRRAGRDPRRDLGARNQLRPRRSSLIRRIRTLATRAFMGRRKETFRPELIAALQIVQAGDITPAQMKSSWAGALGQPQFLPSYYLDYAFDFDGDGRRDIWNSVPDTLASIANLLLHKGWDPGARAGASRSPCRRRCLHLEGPEQGRGIAEWAQARRPPGRRKPPPPHRREPDGVSADAGRPFRPGLHRQRQLLCAEGIQLLRPLRPLYRPSRRPLHRQPTLRRRLGQGRRLHPRRRRRDAAPFEAKGFDVGGADGLVGFKTRVAVGEWQAKNGDKVTCMPDAPMLRSVR